MSNVATYSPGCKPIEMLSGRRRAWRVSEDEFKVFGRAGHEYRILVAKNGLPCCPCEAGRRGKPCWHAALVLARLQREAGCTGVMVEIDVSDFRKLGDFGDGPARVRRMRENGSRPSTNGDRA